MQEAGDDSELTVQQGDGRAHGHLSPKTSAKPTGSRSVTERASLQPVLFYSPTPTPFAFRKKGVELAQAQGQRDTKALENHAKKYQSPSPCQST